MEAVSATRIAEQDLLRWVLAEGPATGVVARALDLRATHRVAFEVAAPVLPVGRRLTGALDALLWPVGEPSRATAVEAKRVRVPDSAFDSARVGGLVQLRKGAQQVNAHVRRGFYRAVLVVLIAVDGRARSGGHWLGGGLSPDLSHVIRERLDALDLEPAAGLLALVVEQPVDRDVRLAGGVGVLMFRPAAARRQDPDLTRGVALLDQSHAP